MPTKKGDLQIFAQFFSQIVTKRTRGRLRYWCQRRVRRVSLRTVPSVSACAWSESSFPLDGWAGRESLVWSYLFLSPFTFQLALIRTFSPIPRIEPWSIHPRSILGPFSIDLFRLSSFSAGKKPTSSRPNRLGTQNLRHVRLSRWTSRLYIVL